MHEKILEKRAALLRNDSVHGDFPGTVSVDVKKNALIINCSSWLIKKPFFPNCSYRNLWDIDPKKSEKSNSAKNVRSLFSRSTAISWIAK